MKRCTFQTTIGNINEYICTVLIRSLQHHYNIYLRFHIYPKHYKYERTRFPMRSYQIL